MMEERADMTSLISWMTKARPGWKLYIVHVAGYTREAPELKYYDKAELRWMIPLEYVDTEPLAVATVEVEKSTNPMLAWSYKIDAMPSEQKGIKDGIMSILKDGSKVTQFKFGIEYKYLESGDEAAQLLCALRNGRRAGHRRILRGRRCIHRNGDTEHILRSDRQGVVRRKAPLNTVPPTN